MASISSLLRAVEIGKVVFRYSSLRLRFEFTHQYLINPKQKKVRIILAARITAKSQYFPSLSLVGTVTLHETMPYRRSKGWPAYK